MSLTSSLLAQTAQQLLLTKKQEDDKHWALHATLNNSVGIGTFVAGYSNNPSFTTMLTLNPSYDLPQFWNLPNLSLSANLTANIWWVNSFNTRASDFENRLGLWDLNLEASMPEVWKHERSGFRLGAALDVLAPTSLQSQRISRIIAFGGSVPIRWSKWGFSAGWTPSVLGWIFSSPVISGPCYELPGNIIRPDNLAADAGQFMQGLVITKNQGDVVGEGRCLVSGRQSTVSLNNMFSLGWSKDAHSVSALLGWFINFLRPLEEKPELKAQFATGQNFTEATLGRLAYSYRVPIETELSLSGGVISIQASYDREGNLSFPFFDFRTPSNNQTQFFLQATVGI